MTTLAVLPLLEVLREYAEDPDLPYLLDPDHPERSWTQLLDSEGVQLWLISWPPGSRTGWHDHGIASGAFTVLRGQLTEHTWGELPEVLSLTPGVSKAFGASHIHDVRNDADVPALSLHAYSPRLDTMTRYALRDGRLEIQGVEQAGDEW